LGIRASVSGCERTNGGDDEPCCSQCVQNSGGFIGWRATYLRTNAHPKAPPTHMSSRSTKYFSDSFWLRTAWRSFQHIKTKNTDKIGSSTVPPSMRRCWRWSQRLLGVDLLEFWLSKQPGAVFYSPPEVIRGLLQWDYSDATNTPRTPAYNPPSVAAAHRTP